MELGITTKAGQKRVEKERVEKADTTREARHARFALSVRDPQPVTEVARFWRTAAQAATIGMFLILLL